MAFTEKERQTIIEKEAVSLSSKKYGAKKQMVSKLASLPMTKPVIDKPRFVYK